jgi:glycine cleavage system H protein
MNFPSDLKYTKDHEWVRVDGENAYMGITTFAANQLGDIVMVEANKVGDSVSAGDEVGTIESVKAVAEVFAPVSGEILKVNTELESSPELVNEDAYGEGWFLQLKLSNPKELDNLMDAAAYAAFVAEADH